MDDEEDRAPEVFEWLDRYRTRLWETARLDELAMAVTATICEEVEELRAEPSITSYLSQSTRAILRTYFSSLLLTPPEGFEAPTAALELGRAVARRGWPAPLLLQMYRIGQREVWLPIMSGAASITDDDLREKVLNVAFTHLSRSVDHLLGQVLQAHAVDFELQIRGAELNRVETVQAILAGDEVDVDNAIAQLGHNFRQLQTSLVVWAEDGERGDLLPQVEKAVRQIAAALGGPKPLLVRREARAWWGWVATDTVPPLEAVQTIFTEGLHPGMQVAVGHTAAGLTGFRDSHRDALLAQRVAQDACRRCQVTLYRDIELIACMSAEPAAMHALARRHLGQLASPGVHAQRSRETLAAYLAEGSASRAAEQLGVHKNTVLYRLRRLEEQLGPLADLPRPLVQVALQIVDIYGAHLP